jgi:hypothetical protein
MLAALAADGKISASPTDHFTDRSQHACIE